MGAISFSLSPDLVKALADALPLEVLVETGTFEGDTVAAFAGRFEEVHSVELSDDYFRKATSRFEGVANVHLTLGDSRDFLKALAPRIAKRAVLYFLDAHWCVAQDTAGSHSQCPLLDELAGIGKLGDTSVIVIDDARLFLAPPPEPHDVTQWPSFDEIVTALRRLNPRHELMVVNDVIAFYPAAAHGSMERYARKHGVDWLHASQALAETAALRGGLREKEDVIQAQHRALGELQQGQQQLAKQLDEKEAVIQGLSKAARPESRRRTAHDLDGKVTAEFQTLHAEIHHFDEHVRMLSHGLEEKEAVIQALHRAVDQIQSDQRLLARGLEEKEAVIKTLQRAVETSEGQYRLLSRALADKEAVIQTLERAVETSEGQYRLLTQALVDKESAVLTMHMAVDSPEMHHVLVKGLEEKEAVIQELSRALESYRAAFSVFGFFLRPLTFGASTLRRVTRRAAAVCAPRLGVLNQYSPRKLSVPAHYSRPQAMANAPRISLVTPSFRQAGYIERTLRSVLDQEYPNLEYHVQDGGSTDGTPEILQRYAGRLARWDSRPDKGQSEAINLGFAGTTGEIMAWLNSDDILLPGALAYVADYFTRHPAVDVVYGHRILIDENDDDIGRWMMPAHNDEVLSWADYVPQETLFWRRRIWEKVGARIDESFRFAMDWDLLVRFREAGARFARLPRFLGGFRIHPHQKTCADISDVGFREMDRIRERVLGRVPSGFEVRKAIVPYLLKHVATDLGWRIQSRLGVHT